VPNPLRLEAVLGGIFGLGAEEFSIHALKGKTILHLLTSLALYQRHPFDHAALLAERVQVALKDDRLAELLANSGILPEVIPSLGWQPLKAGVD
jgi:hypothetical protein